MSWTVFEYSRTIIEADNDRPPPGQTSGRAMTVRLFGYRETARWLLVGQGAVMPAAADLAFVGVFAVVMMGICVALLNRKKN